jgi:hypothetical protein
MSVSTAARPASVSAQEAGERAVEAYVYLYPLVLMELSRRQLTNAPAGTRPGSAPMGQFAHVRAFPPAEFRTVVRPNFDTLYSSAWLDLTREPMIVSVPDTDGRYYLLPLLDMWTDVFAAPGKRTTGTRAASYAVLPPDWRGELPAGVEPIPAPTTHVWAIGRTQTNGPADYAAVHRIQDGFTVTPLSGWGTPAAPVEPVPDPSVDMHTEPMEQVHALSGEKFFGLAAELLRRHRPHPTDWSILARLRQIGLRPDDGWDPGTLDDTVRRALHEAPVAARAVMQEAAPRMARVVNGWLMNTDTMGVYGNHYLKRAVVAMMGLGANQPEDAVYPLAVADAEGQPLDGNHEHLLHFDADQLPPVTAFWSVTMYDAEGFQVANPIDRFAVGDRDELAHNADGSLDLYLQHDDPGPARAANWLPAPRGPLGVTMRLYAPAPQVLDGRWNPPPIRRIR